MSTRIGSTRNDGVFIEQMLDVTDDSIFYQGGLNQVLICKVDSNGYLTDHAGAQIGKFSLRDDHWYFKLEDGTEVGGNYRFPLFKLPEFELDLIPHLISRGHLSTNGAM